MEENKKFTFGGSSEVQDVNLNNNAVGVDAPAYTQNTVRRAANANDARIINVSITDKKAPMVILFGPPSCGKTMTLVRLTKYLKGKYSFEPDQAFRNSSDAEYEQVAEKFSAAVESDKAADGTALIDFMLVRLIDRKSGRTFCQFVESPGELLFNPDNPKQDFPAYLHQIIASPNRKIWLIFLEPGKSEKERKAYVEKIKDLRTIINERDRIIFVENKVDHHDTHAYIMSRTSINMSGLYRHIDGLYPNLFATFTKEGIFWSTKQYDFTAFQTGTYAVGQDNDGKIVKTFQAGDDSHPARLWQVIKKRITG